MRLSVREERASDHEAVRAINRLAFGGDEEENLVAALRESADLRLSMVAEVEGVVVGHIMFSRLSIVTDSETIEALALAPVAVHPDHQRRGVGSALVRSGLQACAERGDRIVIVLGHPEYYPRFGFSAALAERIKAPFSGPAFMALELVPNALAGVEGVVRYASAFGLET